MASLPFPQCNTQCPGEAPGSSPAEEEASRALPWGLTTPPALPHTALAPSVIWLAPGDCVSTGQDKQHQHHLGTSRSTNSLAPESELQAVQLEQLSQYCGGLGATWGAPHASHSSASGDLGLKILHFRQAPKWCWPCCSEDSLGTPALHSWVPCNICSSQLWLPAN